MWQVDMTGGLTAGFCGQIRMAVVSLLAVQWLTASPATAQTWEQRLAEDEAYVGGWVALPGSTMSVSCAARSPRNGSIIDSLWFETSIAAPWFYMINVSETLIPYSMGQRGDVILFADQTGYRLPPLTHNEMEGGWQVELPMTDPMFGAIEKASRLVLQVGSQAAWDLPVANLATGLDRLQQTCGATWSATGYPAPAGLGAPVAAAVPNVALPGLDLWAVAEQFAASNCSDFFTAGPNGVRRANIDGDGIPDVVLDYSDITCDQSASRPLVCGASMCSVDVFLSSTFPRTGEPEMLMGLSSAIIPLSNGNEAVATSGNLAACGGMEACNFIWYWDGTALRALPQ